MSHLGLVWFSHSLRHPTFLPPPHLRRATVFSSRPFSLSLSFLSLFLPNSIIPRPRDYILRRFPFLAEFLTCSDPSLRVLPCCTFSKRIQRSGALTDRPGVNIPVPCPGDPDLNFRRCYTQSFQVSSSVLH
jgi:hypothetical protein